MCSRWLSLTALLLGSAVVLAQQPGPQQLPQAQPIKLDPANNRLDAILVQWETAMSSVNSLYTSVKRTDIDNVLRFTKVYEGYAKYLKPNKAILHLGNTDPKRNQEFEKLVCNGQIAYKWEPSKKEIQVYEMPKPKQGQINDDNFVSMLFGMKALDAKRRYTLELTQDATYDYIMVEPRDPQDRAEFSRARLALNNKTHLPVQIFFEQPNRNETFWDFSRMATNLQIDQKEFNQPVPPAGWDLKKVMLDGPRTIRAQQ